VVARVGRVVRRSEQESPRGGKINILNKKNEFFCSADF